MIFDRPLQTRIDNDITLQRVGENEALLTVIVHKSMAEKNALALIWYHSILAKMPCWLRDCVLSFETVLLRYDGQKLDYYKVLNWLKSLSLQEQQELAVSKHVIPVCYETIKQSLPNDMSKVGQYTGLSAEKLIELHTLNSYKVFAIGFMPNFAYLGELPAQLHIQRLATPRLRVPSGAVAIADKQTAIYPCESPGGWHILGYTPYDMSYAHRRLQPNNNALNGGSSNSENSLFKAGDSVQFQAISASEFMHYLGK